MSNSSSPWPERFTIGEKPNLDISSLIAFPIWLSVVFSLFFFTISIAAFSAFSLACINFIYFFSGVKSRVNAVSAMQPLT